MTAFRAGDAIFNMTPSLGPSSGSSPTQPVTSFGSASASVDIDLAGGSIMMVILGHSPEAAVVDELVTDLWLLGDFPMRYRVWAVWQDFDEHGDDRVSFQAVTYERLINRRLVGAGGLLYNNTDVGVILWNAIQHTQAKPGGDLGITAGSISTGITASIDWAPGENIGAKLEEVMKAAGCYWVVDHNKELNVYARRATVPKPERVVWGDNARHMQRASAGVGFANSVYLSGSPDTTPLFSVHPDILTDPRGLWESASAQPTKGIQDELAAAAVGELELRYQALSRWNVTYVSEHWVGPSRVRPGDKVDLIVPPSLAGPQNPPRSVEVECISMSLGFDGDGGLEVRAVFEELSGAAQTASGLAAIGISTSASGVVTGATRAAGSTAITLTTAGTVVKGEAVPSEALADEFDNPLIDEFDVELTEAES